MKTKQAVASREHILARHPAMGLQQLMKATQALIQIADRETQALLTNDLLALSILQYEKDRLTFNYVELSQQFRARVEEFRAAGTSLIDRLEQLQIELGAKENENIALVKQIEARAEEKARQHLDNIHAISQKVHVRFDKTFQENSVSGGQGV